MPATARNCSQLLARSGSGVTHSGWLPDHPWSGLASPLQDGTEMGESRGQPLVFTESAGSQAAGGLSVTSRA